MTSPQRPGVALRFWERVEKERVARGWSKARLAEEAGLHRPTIDNLKSGVRAPYPRTVHPLADALDIDRREAEELAGLVAPSAPPRGAGPVDAVYLVVYAEGGAVGWAGANRDRAHELARNTGGLVCLLPVLADYRPQEDS